jgi:hypothetical protein
MQFKPSGKICAEISELDFISVMVTCQHSENPAEPERVNNFETVAFGL